jgi:hypothetical protein
MKLKNATGARSRLGLTVILDPKNPNAFVYSTPDATNIIGIVGEEVSNNDLCEVITSGIARVFVSDLVIQGSVIRAQKSSDHISRGFCKTAKSTDAPYFKIGTATETGRGLVRCNLGFVYLSSGAVQSGVVTVTSTPYTVGETDNLIICNSLVAITINLPVASGTGRELQIANINIGVVTVEGNLAETINGELNQLVYEDSCMDVKDYGVGTWVII